MVVRLEDKREIQVRIPGTISVAAQGREIGDWVDIGFEAANRKLDKGLNWMLCAELTDIQSFRKPSDSELEVALASRSRKYPGNLLTASGSPDRVESEAGVQDAFADVRQQINAYVKRLPEFMAHEVTTRYKRPGSQDASVSQEWTQVDQIQTEVWFNRRHEIRTNITRNGQIRNDITAFSPSRRPFSPIF